MSWAGLLAAGCGMAIAQLVKAIAGFGSALVAMPVLLLLLDPAEAILVMVATDLFSGTWLVWDVWNRIRWPLVLAVLAGVAPGQWVGTELLHYVDPVWVARVLGVVVFAMGTLFAIKPVTPGVGERLDLPEDPKPLLALAAVSGLTSGVMSGLVGVAGPPLVAYCKRFFEEQFYRAQLIAVLHLSGMVLTAMLLAKGADRDAIRIVPWLLVPLVLGNRLGAWLAPRMSRERFGRFTGVVLAGAGLALIVGR